MRYTFFIQFFILLMTLSMISAQDKSRGVQVIENDLGNKIGGQYVALIAVDRYPHWYALKSPVKDARELKRIISGRYYMNRIYELYNENATKANVIKLFRQLQDQVTTHDSLFIFYSGNGFTPSDLWGEVVGAMWMKMERLNLFLAAGHGTMAAGGMG